MGQFAIGQAVRRREDQRLLTGSGSYTDDLRPSDAAAAVFVRSPHAHAEVLGIDAEDAASQAGVLGVFTIADLDAEDIGDNPCIVPLKGKNGTATVQPPRPILARKRVRHVGEPVVAVVAETLEQALEAADLVMIDYAELDHVVDTGAAMDEESPQIWDQAPRNLCLDWEEGDREATARAFAEARHVTRLSLVNNRIIVNPMEPRVALGQYERKSGRFTLTTPTQGSHRLRDWLTQHIFKLPSDKVRVITPDVGGAFGMKIFLYNEQVFVLWAAKKLGRAVHWVSERTEGFISDSQGRDHVTEAELALNAEGRFLALRAKTVAAMGAYLSSFGPYIPTACYAKMLPGAYRIPAVHVESACVFTNTVPVDAYRGAGRPEAIYVLERLVDQAASELGLAPEEIRRRNFVRSDDLPFQTATGENYDSGDFPRLMEMAIKNADWAGFAQRRTKARDQGRLRGIGMAYYLESCAGFGQEEAKLVLLPDGTLRAALGTQDNGQGHATAYAQIIESVLGIENDAILVEQGDSDELTAAWGTGGSRSALMGGSAAVGAAEKLLERARAIASEMLQSPAVEISLEGGAFTSAGGGRVSWGEIARHCESQGTVLEESFVFKSETMTYPNGCHVCEVEVDPDTGVTRVVNYVVVDDFGRLINPILVRGQVLGGIAQGLGQALLEDTCYDSDSGQLVSGSFMDYALPRADDMPPVSIDLVEDYPCRTNALGIKGAGEAGAIGACPAVMNALLDALRPAGVRHLDMPATAEKIWRALSEARAASERHGP